MSNEMNAVSAQAPQSPNGEFNTLNFLIDQRLSRVNTAQLVKIIAVSVVDPLAPVGFLDVEPLVNQMSPGGQQVEHGPIYNIPYCRIQGGANAFIVTPKIGDIGLVAFCQGDISGVKSTKAKSNPKSKRKFSYSDAVYVGGTMNQVPVRYVMIKDDGISIISDSDITIKAPRIKLEGALTIIGAIQQSGGIINAAINVIAAGISLIAHVHKATKPGLPNELSGGPQ